METIVDRSLDMAEKREKRLRQVTSTKTASSARHIGTLIKLLYPSDILSRARKKINLSRRVNKRIPKFITSPSHRGRLWLKSTRNQLNRGADTVFAANAFAHAGRILADLAIGKCLPNRPGQQLGAQMTTDCRAGAELQRPERRAADGPPRGHRQRP